MAGDDGTGRASAEKQSALEWFRGYRIFEIIVVGAIVASATWAVANEVLVRPRDFAIERCDKELDHLREKVRELQEMCLEPSDTEETVPNPAATTILEPTWLVEGEAVQILSGQVLIVVSSVSDFRRSASFDLQILREDPIRWEAVSTGARETFQCKGDTYLFDVLEVRGGKVSIAVSRQV